MILYLEQIQEADTGLIYDLDLRSRVVDTIDGHRLWRETSSVEPAQPMPSSLHHAILKCNAGKISPVVLPSIPMPGLNIQSSLSTVHSITWRPMARLIYPGQNNSLLTYHSAGVFHMGEM